MDGILDFLKDLWNALRPILAICALVLAIYFTFGGAAISLGFGVSIGGTAGAILAGGAAILLDSDTVVGVVSDIMDGVGEIASDVVSTTIDAVAGGLGGSSFISSLGTALLIGGAAYLGYQYYSSKKEEDAVSSASQDSSNLAFLDSDQEDEEEDYGFGDIDFDDPLIFEGEEIAL